MENASAAFLEAVRKCMAPIRVAVGSGPIDPELLTHAERIQYEGHVRREATASAILSLSQQGMPLKQIARRTGHSRKLVRNTVRGLTGEVFRSRQNSLEAFLPRLDAEWAAGCRNGRELWRRLGASGFGGSLRVVGEWAELARGHAQRSWVGWTAEGTRRRRCEQAPDHTPRRVPSARALARLLTAERDHLSRMDAILVATVEAEVPAVAEARSAMLRFQSMIRDRRAPDLDAWISDARATLIASFAAGITRDRPAVAAALTQPWSNGQTEGQITRLKLVKRQMLAAASSTFSKRG